MSFVALRLDVAGSAAGALSDALLAQGALSVDLTDPRAGTPDETPLFDEPAMAGTASTAAAPAPTAAWAAIRVTALFPEAADVGRALDQALAAIGSGLLPYETNAVADQDWVQASRDQFVPLQITDALWIVPSWHAAVDPAAVNLVLDPGLAFGTGSHPTTRLCLRWLARTMHENASVLDYGCGSGILAIAARLLGASRVVGVDIDPQALVAARENATRNGVAGTFVLPDRLIAAERFDVVVANILANPLILLACALAARVVAGGRIVLSGILASQADEVIAAYAPWFRIGRGETEDGWVALVGERSAVRTAV